jgi:dipeptidyl aminopeptidase/acylaminoacyl peptidase
MHITRSICSLGQRLAPLAILIALLPPAVARAEEMKGLKLEGNRFTFEDGKVAVRGILVKPEGKGPFPAILISHGLGGNAERFGTPKAREFAGRGFVCIAPDYTHSDPRAGDRATFGASAENIRRAKKCLDILASLPEVNPKRLYALGNSMGAFLTIGLAAEDDRLAAAAITAGGVVPTAGFAAPSKEAAAKIKTPFLILHGTKDTTVPPERSAMLEAVLKENKVVHERVTYEGIGHDLQSVKAKEVSEKVEGWFKKHAGKAD